MKCKITRPNGEVVELEGTQEEVEAVLAKPQTVQYRLVPTIDHAKKPADDKDQNGERQPTWPILDWYKWPWFSPKPDPWTSPFFWRVTSTHTTL